MIDNRVLRFAAPTRYLLALAATLFGATISQGDEAVVSMDVELRVSDGGVYEVTETIKVRAENNQINHGIYRDIPTTTRLLAGALIKKHDLQIVSVSRDDQREPYHDEYTNGLMPNTVRVYIGDESHTVAPGIHTYRIVYRTNGWATLGISDTQDEVSWNVTGQDWKFPIESATFTLLLPGEIPADQLDVSAWTGSTGDTKQNWQLAKRTVSRVEAMTTEALAVGEGWTVATRLPQGVLKQSSSSSTTTLLIDNAASLLAILGLFGSVLAYGFVWILVGKDPPSHVVTATPEAPSDVSPVDARYLRRMGYDHQCFAIGLISAAKAGALSIEPTTGKPGQEFVVHREEGHRDSMSLPPVERLIVEGLLGTRNQMKLGAYNDSAVKNTIKSVQDDLKHRIAGHWFQRNYRWLIPGFCIGLCGIIPAILMNDAWPVAIFLTFWLSFWSLGVTVLVMVTFAAWKSVLGGDTESEMGWPIAIFLTVFTIPFLCGEIAGLVFFTLAAGPVAAASLVIFGIMTAFMFRWIKAPTLAGREILDRIDSYERWLRNDLPRRLQQVDASQQLKLVDDHLPWIMALGVSDQAHAGLASTLVSTSVTRSDSMFAEDHRPAWYRGKDFGRFAQGGVGRGLAAAGLAAAVMSSNSPKPNSSSGSSFGGGGGGSVGSGGGGGGGGGW